MSSKGAQQTTASRAAWRSSWSWSITGRLTVLYTCSAFAILVLSSVFLYWVLVSNVAKGGEQFLSDKIHVLRMILRERPNNPEALEEEVKWEGTALHFARYYARIVDADGHILTETPGMSAMLPAGVFPAPSGGAEELGDGLEWRSPDRRTYLLRAAWTKVGRFSGTQRLLQVALDVSQADELLHAYRRKLALVLFVGTACAAGAGAAVARQGMHPLRAITEAAQRITPTRLHERIDPTRWPKELTILATAFDEMLTRLEDSFTRLAQFAADLAHELRTPINNLMGEAEVVLSRARPPHEYRQVLESSLEEYARLSQMIDSLLFLARADSAEARIERSQFDAVQAIEAVREFHEAVAEEQGVEVTCHGKAVVNADPMLFRRAVSNLLSNALQYTSRGGRVSIAVEQTADHAVDVRVSDTGSGIDSAHLPRIFDRFYRADRARSQHASGTGLGLAIVKSIMTLHNGTVTIQSEPAKGTTVTLRFPLRH